MNRSPAIPREMHAVVYRGPGLLEFETVPVPSIRAGELMVKVAVCGVCPTDIKKIDHGTVPPPRIFGHETAGIIARVGTGVKGWGVGDRVALHHHVPCLDCHFCNHHTFAQCSQYKRTGITAGFEPAGGGYGEYVRVMPFVLPGVVRIPARNTFEEGAMLEPVNTVLKAVRRLKLIPGDAVLVAGQGPIGLVFTRLLALEGMRVLATDLLETRLRLARNFGATAVFNASRQASNGLKERVMKMTRNRGVDAAVVAVPLDRVVHEALGLMRGGGQVLLFSHTRKGVETPLDLAQVCVDEKDLIGSYSSDFLLQDEVARLVFSRKLDVRKIITHTYPLRETAKAINHARKPTPDSLKILVVQK